MRLGARNARDRGTGDGRGIVTAVVTDLPAAGNLLLTPSFEVDSNSDGLADSWSQYAGTTTIVPTIGGGTHGTKSQRLTPSAGSYCLINQKIPCTAGLQYTLTTAYRIVALNGGQAVFKVEWYQSDGTTGVSADLYDFDYDNVSTGAYLTDHMVRTAPATAAFANVVLSGEGGCVVDYDFASFVQG